MIDKDLIAVLGFALMFVLMLLRVPIGVAMGITGVLGYGIVSGWGPALALLGKVPLSTVTDYKLAVIPMFILMGSFAAAGGMSRELFNAGSAWFGHLRGGLAIGSIAACGGFAAINGSSVATVATMTNVALPEMRRAGYDPGFAAGVIAAGGTLGIMIPPSVIFVLYGIMTETDISQLFAAGVLPGLLAMVMYAITIQVVGRTAPAAHAARRPPQLARALQCAEGNLGDRSAVPACTRRHLRWLLPGGRGGRGRRNRGAGHRTGARPAVARARSWTAWSVRCACRLRSW